MKKLLLFLSIALLCTLDPCFGQNVNCDGLLRGVKSVGVIIGDAPLFSDADFMAQIKRKVEIKLSKEGISIIDLDTVSKPEDKRKFFATSGFLEINGYINDLEKTGVQCKGPFIICTIELMFRQRLELDRKDLTCFLPTWIEGRYNLVCTKAEARDNIIKNVSELIDIFLASYRAENQPEQGKP